MVGFDISLFLVVLFLALAVLFGILEIFIPSFGILTILAVGCVIVSIWQAFSISPIGGFCFLILLMFAIPFFVWMLLTMAPKTVIGKKVFLETQVVDQTAADPIREEFRRLFGHWGKAVSVMMPSGKVNVDGKTYDAISESGAVDPGDDIVVVRSEAASLVVRRATEYDTRPKEASDREAPDEPRVEDPYQTDSV